MAGLSDTRVYDSLLTTTLDNYRKKMYDNIFDSYPLLSWLNGKLGIAMRGSTVKRVLTSGVRIAEHLLYGKSTAVKAYSGAEVLDTTLQEGHTMAFFNWKQYSAPVGITGLEKRSNSGEAELIALLEAKAHQAEMSLRDTLSVDAFSDGTANGSKVLGGLQAIVSATATIGGLSPTTFAWWQSTVTSSVGSFASNGRSKMVTTFNTLSYGNDKPDFIITDQNVFEYYETATQGIERITNTKVGDIGFQNLTFKNVPVLFDRDCPSGYMYFLNSKYINFVVHKEADMTPGPFITPKDGDVSTSNILFQGNLTTNNRRMLGVMTGITT